MRDQRINLGFREAPLAADPVALDLAAIQSAPQPALTIGPFLGQDVSHNLRQ
ncbi:Uncharacterised protein [Mycobacteroides abscessus subsp. abscessus]|nr:Uncharacterised protein [Mycobacteroides abscessus subsp. abscessus]